MKSEEEGAPQRQRRCPMHPLLAVLVPFARMEGFFDCYRRCFWKEYFRM